MSKRRSIALLLALAAMSGQSILFGQDGLLDEEKLAVSESMEFQAHRVRDRVELKWTVAGKAQFFAVERSLDRELWEPIIHMSGSHETVNRTTYFDIDYNIPSAKLFYRVVQTFDDGTKESSDVYFVPAFDELGSAEERLIKTIHDPLELGDEIQLNFVNMHHKDEILLVLRDQCGDEYFAKIHYSGRGNVYIVYDISGDIPSGQYLITASSKRGLYSNELRIELTD